MVLRGLRGSCLMRRPEIHDFSVDGMFFAPAKDKSVSLGRIAACSRLCSMQAKRHMQLSPLLSLLL